MKETVKITSESKRKKLLYGVLLHIAVAAMGFFSSRGCVANVTCPFGVGFCAGVSSNYAATAAAGAILGYIFPQSGVGFVYIAACFAVCAVKLLLTGVKKANKMPVLDAVIAFCCAFAVNFVTFGFAAALATRGFFEAVLAALCAFATANSSIILSRIISGLRTRQLCYLIITFNAVFMGMFTVRYSTVNIGCILCTAVICAVAATTGLSGGAAAGICGGIGYMLTYPADALPFACFAAAGLICGASFIYGKAAGTLSYLAAACGMALLSGFSRQNAALVACFCFGTALFVMIPKTLLQKAGRLVSPPVNTYTVDGMCNALSIRLNFAAKALCDVSQTVDDVSKKIAQKTAPSFENIIENTKRDACNGCLMKTRCWETLKSETVDSVIELAHFTRKGEKPKLSERTVEFGGRCSRMEAVMEVVSRNYSEYLSRLAAQSNNERVRKAISGQLYGISRMLNDISTEFCSNNRFDVPAAKLVAASLYDLGLASCACSCRVDANNRMNVEIEAKASEDTVINRLKLNSILNAVCHREFETPKITRNKENVLITAIEPPVFELQTGVAQLSCDSNACGDSYGIFEDGRGRLIMLLSDGMGHGAAAALDSNMATNMMQRLISAGFGYDCSLEIVNSSMIYKSVDESLATVDIAAFDLFCGKVSLYKAGAAPTIMLKSGNICKAQSSSFPVGILDNARFDCAQISLKAGDILLVMSDGATCTGTEWICNLLKEWKNGTAQELAEKIASLARIRRDDGHSDDITVLAAVIKESVNS